MRFRKKPIKTRKLIIDSNGLIDGRIVDLVEAGFTPSEIIIPQFILKELQMLADGNDSQKRERARYGLDVGKKLMNTNTADVKVNRQQFPNIKTVDDKLVLLARKLGADLYTADYNLNKVATIEGIRVLNINELAQAMRPVALPGETKKVKIVQKGSGKGQGVGYLEDGTMVVVDNAANKIGATVEIEVARYHQTESGKMLFASVKLNNHKPKSRHQKNRYSK